MLLLPQDKSEEPETGWRLKQIKNILYRSGRFGLIMVLEQWGHQNNKIRLISIPNIQYVCTYTADGLFLQRQQSKQTRCFHTKAALCCGHSAFDLLLFLLKIGCRPCQMTQRQIIRDCPLWHSSFEKSRGRWRYHLTVFRLAYMQRNPTEDRERSSDVCTWCKQHICVS